MGEILNRPMAVHTVVSGIQYHYHFVCEQCGRVYDLGLPVNDVINGQIAEEYGVSVSRHRLEFYGTCKACLALSEEELTAVK